MVEKQFNIEEAKLIQDGKLLGSIKTRDGFNVTVLCWNVASWFPVTGIVHLGDNNDYTLQWTSAGKVFPHKRTSRRDLVLQVEGGEV